MTLEEQSAKRRQVKKAKRREEKAAQEIGGRRCSGSGSGIVKGDARNDLWMLEDKHTEARRFTITEDVVSKALAQASKTGRNPVIRIGTKNYNLALLMWSDFVGLIDED